jgi:hypothetical protein
LTLEDREFLGPLAGSRTGPAASVAADNHGQLNTSAAMIPIKLGKRQKEEPVMVNLIGRNVLQEEEVEEERDSQLLSRSKCTHNSLSLP